MRFLVDECAGPALANWLDGEGHDVVSIYDEHAGIDDDEVLQMANDEDRVLVTNDKDFGEAIFRDGKPHCGVVLLRLRDERSANKITVMERLLDQYADQLEGRFVVASESAVRISN